MKLLALTSVVAASLVGLVGSSRAGEWTIDPAHSSAQFTVRHMMVTDVRGTFDKVSGTVQLDDKDPAKSVVAVTIDAASINTRDAKRDEHLRSPDFFDVSKNPHITFNSTKIKKVGKDKYKVTGDLTINAITKPVTLDVTGPTAAIKNPWGMTVRGVSASGKISRKDFGLTWNKALETGGVVVGDEVKMQIDAELVEKAPAATAAADNDAAKPAAAPGVGGSKSTPVGAKAPPAGAKPGTAVKAATANP